MQSNRQEASYSHSARILTAAGHFLEVLTLLVAVWAVGDDTLLVSHVTSHEWLALLYSSMLNRDMIFPRAFGTLRLLLIYYLVVYFTGIKECST